MPLYEYSCRSCGERFEILQSLGENGDNVSCPSCGYSEVEKVFSTFAAAGVQGGRTSSELGAQPSSCCRGTHT